MKEKYERHDKNIKSSEDENESSTTETNSILNYSYSGTNINNLSYVTVEIKSNDHKSSNNSYPISKIPSPKVSSNQYYEKLAYISDGSSVGNININYSSSNNNSGLYNSQISESTVNY